MKTKHIIILSLAIVAAVFVGRAWGRYETNLRAVAAYESIPEILKKEFQGMTKEDFEHIMTAIKGYSKNAVMELSLKDLFEAMTIYRIEIAQKENGNEEVDRYITEAKERFLAGYHNGSSNYGGWKKLADKIALKFLEGKTESNQAP